jgi:hypothetical protein
VSPSRGADEKGVAGVPKDGAAHALPPSKSIAPAPARTIALRMCTS